MTIEVKAPSNIALIKYMGKAQVEGNRPTNASLSYTLNHLNTELRLSSLDNGTDQIKTIPGEYELRLSDKGRKRFLNFFDQLKKTFSLKGSFLIESGNNFPSDCGLASSASSFAALTLAAHEMALKSKVLDQPWSKEKLASVSQTGSGSSCRSFFSPFSVWDEDGARGIDLGISSFKHSVLILEQSKKLVSSSQAHVQVLSSSMFQGRVERAALRLQKLIESFINKDWKSSFEICWAEFWDMHVLFETSVPSFGYLNPSSLLALSELRQFWKERGDGPLVTMDAGPNIHLLFRENQGDLQEELLKTLQHKISDLRVINS